MNPEKIKLLDFYEFIYDRHLVWYKKERVKKSYPWTNDYYLKTFKFCNVYRELDAGTIVLINNVLKRKDLSVEDKILNIFLYRRFNVYYFFDLFGVQKLKIYNWKSLEKKMDKEKSKGTRLFSDAYIICQRYYTKKYRIHDKHIQQILLIESLRKKFHEFEFHKLSGGGNCIEILHETLVKKIPMTGNFLAYQYCTDISYIPELKNCFEDINEFVAMGPGSKPGVDLLFPEKKKCQFYADRCRELHSRQEEFFSKLYREKRKNWNNISYNTSYNDSDYLSLSNIQNCLCEFRKYVMLQRNPKSKKRYYKPEGIKK